jgi:hypothetical protein
VVLNHLPIYGTILGALALAISLLLRSRAAQITALTITLVGAASAYPVFISGQRAYKAIRGMSDDTGAEWLDEHMDRAEKTIGAFYLLAALGVAGLIVPIKWPKSAFPLAVLTLVAAILCSGIAVYIAQPGGRVRHPEFRPNETPTPASETDHHDNNEPIFYSVSRFGPLSRLCDGVAGNIVPEIDEIGEPVTLLVGIGEKVLE